MNCIFLRRGYEEIESEPTPIAVTITGTGDTTYCYATINGTKYYGAGSYEVMPGDKITFGVYGRSTTYTGKVTIDGTDVLSVTNQTTQTYEWTVPDGVTAITIAMSYTSSSYQRNGKITVTTTKGGSSGGGGGKYTVSIEAPGYSWHYVEINGTQYTSAAEVTITAGTSITVCVSNSSTHEYITLNGTTVANATSSQNAVYTFVPSSNVQIKIYMPSNVYIAEITTE